MSRMLQPTRNKKSGIYYFVKDVPKDIRELVGKTKFKKSLGTKNLAEAILKFHEEYKETERIIELHRQSVVQEHELNLKDIRTLAERFKQKHLDIIDSNSESHHSDISRYDLWAISLNAAGIPAIQENEEESKYTVTAQDRSKARREVLGDELNQLLLDNNVVLTPSNPTYERLLMAIEGVIPFLQKAAMERLLGQYDKTLAAPIKDQELSTANQKIKAPVPKAKGLTIFELYKDFCDYTKRIKGDTDSVRRTLNSYNAAINQFNDVFPNKLVTDISKKDVLEFKALLLKAPNSQLKAVKELPLPKQVELAELENMPTLSTKTVKNKLVSLSAALQHAVDQKLLIETNPVNGTTSDLVNNGAKVLKEDKGYSRQDIAKIFGSELFTGHVHAPRVNYGKATYWLPILAYYTGARAEEIAQLYVSDVRSTDNGIHYIAINENRSDKSVKNKGSVRKIPLHDDVLSLGFVEYVKTLEPSGRVFPLLEKSHDNRYSANVGKWLGNYFRGELKIDPEIQPMHGFRHCFKTLARSAGMDSKNIDTINGHHDGSASRDYGDFELGLLKREIDKYPSLNVLDRLLNLYREL